MNVLLACVAQLLHVALLLAIAPVLVGFISWIQARLIGRGGQAFVQPWQDLLRLLRKQPVVAENASGLFAVAPLVCFAAVGTAASLVPSFTLGMAFAPLSDLLVIAGLLALTRCALALAGMDAGTALGGMGASRTMTLACLGEPALLLAIFTLALFAGSSNLDTVAAMQQEGGAASWTSLGLALAAIVLVAIADIGRGPIGGVGAHPQLAMLHQAMLLEYSGRDLALLEGTETLRLVLWLNLIGAAFLPFGIASAGAGLLAWPLGIACWLVKLLLLATALAVAETVFGRMRLPSVPRLLGFAVLLGLLAAAFLFAGARTV